MPLKFTSKAKRDDLAERLARLANDMMRAWDQGGNGNIQTGPVQWDDIRTAACVVALSEIEPMTADELMAEQEAGYERQKTVTGSSSS